jgi:predicted site-specific integrase-resolvase
VQLLSIGEVALMLGVSVVTLRRWDKAGLLRAVTRTFGGHRRYELAQVRARLPETAARRKTVAYARVWSSDQAEQLHTQALRLEQYCTAQGYQAEVVTDLGSG